jgi:hypothetical protein
MTVAERHLRLVPPAVPTAPTTDGLPSCHGCEHGYIGPCGVFCVEFREFIDDYRVAIECECWEPA